MKSIFQMCVQNTICNNIYVLIVEIVYYAPREEKLGQSTARVN